MGHIASVWEASHQNLDDALGLLLEHEQLRYDGHALQVRGERPGRVRQEVLVERGVNQLHGGKERRHTNEAENRTLRIESPCGET